MESHTKYNIILYFASLLLPQVVLCPDMLLCLSLCTLNEMYMCFYIIISLHNIVFMASSP